MHTVGALLTRSRLVILLLRDSEMKRIYERISNRIHRYIPTTFGPKLDRSFRDSVLRYRFSTASSPKRVALGTANQSFEAPGS